MLTGKVRMIEHIIAQAVCGNGIVDIVALVCIPVLRKFFGAENKHRFVAVLVILDDGKRSESFTKTYAICQPLNFSSLLMMARTASRWKL